MSNQAFYRWSVRLATRVQGSAWRMVERLASSAHKCDEGAVTAEYAVVLIAATAFAGILIAIVKSDVVRSALTDIINKALHVGAK